MHAIDSGSKLTMVNWYFKDGVSIKQQRTIRRLCDGRSGLNGVV
jgi:hypothetical protein